MRAYSNARLDQDPSETEDTGVLRCFCAERAASDSHLVCWERLVAYWERITVLMWQVDRQLRATFPGAGVLIFATSELGWCVWSGLLAGCLSDWSHAAETGIVKRGDQALLILARETCSSAASVDDTISPPHHSGEKISCASIIKPGLQYSHSSACLSIHSMPSPRRSSSAVPARALVQWRLAISMETLMYPSTWTASRTALWSVFSSFGTDRMYGLLPTWMTENDEPSGLSVPTARRMSSLSHYVSICLTVCGEAWHRQQDLLGDLLRALHAAPHDPLLDLAHLDEPAVLAPRLAADLDDADGELKVEVVDGAAQ